MVTNLANFTDVFNDADEIENSQPLSLSSTSDSCHKTQDCWKTYDVIPKSIRPSKHTGQSGEFRSVDEIDPKYREVFSYPYFNLIQSGVIEDALYSDKSMVVCAPTGSGKTVVFEMAIVQLLMELDDRQYEGDFKIIYMAPVKAVCTERLSEWYPKFTKLGIMCIEVTGDTNVDFSQLKPYKLIITTPEKWDMLTRRWRDHRGLVEMIKLFLIDEVHILNDEQRGPVLEAVVSRMKTIESSSQSAHRIEKLQKQYQEQEKGTQIESSDKDTLPPRIRFIAISATISNPDDVAAWLGTADKPAVYYKFGDECRPVKVKRVVEGYPCPEGMSIFKFDIILNYKLWPVIQKHHNGKPTLIFCNTRKSVALTAETLSRELTVTFTPEQKTKLTALASTIKNKKLQALVLSGVGCHHAGLLYEERLNIEKAFRNRDLPILITTTTLAMGVNLPAHLVIIKNTQQYVNGAYQEYSISTILQMIGRAGRPQFDVEATAVIMTRLADKSRYQALVGGSEPLQSYLHKRLPENLNSEAALGTVCDVAQCVQWLRSTFLNVRATKDPKRYLGLPTNAPVAQISKKIEELCVKAMNGLASSGLITMDEASCIQSTEAGRLMSIFYLDLETMKLIMKIEGNESIERLLWIVCESHELADMHLRVDERRTLNALNRNNTAATIRFPMKGKICTRQMKLNCIIQAVLGCLPITDPSLNQEAMKVMRIADRVCKCLVTYVTRPDLIKTQPQNFSTVLNSIILTKCIQAHLWENSPYVSKQLKGIGPTFSTLLATAGKVNFTLLDESHPRDLERIMNKAAPAGNVLRKQVGLLPRYQLTATPRDEKTVNIKLMLLNHHYLAENREHLTAGDTHKCYIIVGDSENHLLLLASFMDKDLISVFDGIINYEISRKHNFEHKILIHCVSASWVGIDVQIEYSFNSLEPLFLRGEAVNPTPIPDTPNRKSNQRQTCITDVYKERKRKNEIDITQSKEKKKRDNALLETFKNLKNSFDVTSKEMKSDLNNYKIKEIIQPCDYNIRNNKAMCAKENKDISRNMVPESSSSVDRIDCFTASGLINTPSKDLSEYPPLDIENLDEDYEVDERIDSILNEIENEIQQGRSSKVSSTNSAEKWAETKTHENDCNRIDAAIYTKPYQNRTMAEKLQVPKKGRNTLDIDKSKTEKRKLKSTHIKSNFNFIDVVNKKQKLQEDDKVVEKNNGFSNAIKQQIERFLQTTTRNRNKSDISLKDLLNYTDTSDKINDDKEQITLENSKSLSQELPIVDIKTSIDKKEKGIENPPFLSLDIVNIHELTEPITLQTRLVNTAVKKVRTQNEKVELEKQNDVIFPKVDNNHTDKQPKENIELQIIKDSPKCTKADIENDTVTSSKYFNEIKIESNINKVNPKAIQYLNNVNSNTEQLQNNITKSDTLEINDKDNNVAVTESLELSERSESPKIFSYKRKIPEIAKLFEDANTSSQEITELNADAERTKVRCCNEISSNEKSIHPIALPHKQACKLVNENNEMSTNLYFSNVVPNDLLNASLDEGINETRNRVRTSDAISRTNDGEYINRHTFTATKVDVFTKNTPEHKVQIIRKFKLDLDITQIVSKTDDYDLKHDDELDKSDQYDEEFTHLESNDTKTSNYIKNMKKLPISETKAILPNNNCDDDDIKKNESESNATSTINNTEDMLTSYEIHSNKNMESLPLIPERKAISPKSICDDDKKKESNATSTSNSIEDILNKYSAILRKSTCFNNNADINKYSLENRRYNEKIKIEKKMRPYNISEIHNLEMPLPKNMITVSRTSKEVTTNREEIDEIISFTKTICDRSKDTEFVRSNDKVLLDSIHFDMHEEIETNDNKAGVEMTEYTVDEIPKVESMEEFNIDQSLLNPKTLLQQCFVQEETDEVIPPPAEFCDENNIYSPKQFQDDFNSSLIEDCVASGFDNNISIFEDHNDSPVLTPSKEIETWTLSIDDEENNVNDSYRRHQELDNNLAKSYTVIRQNSPVNTKRQNPSYTAYENNFGLSSRHHKLGKFKFMHKNKLKPHK